MKFKDYDSDDDAQCGYDSDRECAPFLIPLQVNRIKTMTMILHILWWDLQDVNSLVQLAR